MKCSILMGSPRKHGNTMAITKPFMEMMELQGVEVKLTFLYEKTIKGCTACRTCQRDWSGFGCIQQDDMSEIFCDLLDTDLIVLATPIYSWYCTSPMKAMLDRLVYGMNKYYGEEKGPALWAGKRVALITTCGYEPEKGADLWEEGIRRYCKHSRLEYAGMLAERHMGYKTVFMNESRAERAKAFAVHLCEKTLGGER